METGERQAALAALRRWTTIHSQRDQIIRRAHAAGIPIKQITRETSLDRQTIRTIIRNEDGTDGE